MMVLGQRLRTSERKKKSCEISKGRELLVDDGKLFLLHYWSKWAQHKIRFKERGNSILLFDEVKGKATLQRKIQIGTRELCGHTFKFVLWSLFYASFLHQNTGISSQDIKSLIQLWHQAPSSVSCGLHLVQIRMRLLTVISPRLQAEMTAPYWPGMHWWDQGSSHFSRCFFQRREEWKGGSHHGPK